MPSVNLAFFRVCFFVLLFVSTACTKFEGSLHKDSLDAAPAAMQFSDAERVRQLEGRVQLLEAELKAVNANARAVAEVPGGMNWD